MSTYSQLLRDPRWQRRRLEIMNRDRFTCQECEDTEKTLNVHHKIYRAGAKPWEHEDCDLVCLCEDCHLSVTKTTRELKQLLGELSSSDLEQVLGYVKGLRIIDRELHEEEASLASNAVRSACEFEGLVHALSLGFMTHHHLCSSDTSEADLRAAYEAAKWRPRAPRYEAS